MEKQFFIIEPKCDFCDDLGHTEDECPKRPKCDYCDERGQYYDIVVVAVFIRLGVQIQRDSIVGGK